MLKRPVGLLVPNAHWCQPSYQQRHKGLTVEARDGRICKKRAYSSPANNSTNPPEAEHRIWPRSVLSKSTPTPYEILELKRNAPYSKRRYYELVKIYHPDRSSVSSASDPISSLPKSIQIERYHLIVAAHEILSDPIKRTAYDATGTGWAGRDYPRPRPRRKAAAQRHTNEWSGFHSPFANATWEDWEKWHEQRRGKYHAQEPLYVSNVGFILIVMSAAFVGATAQKINVSNHDAFFRDQHDAANERASEYYREKVMPPHDVTMHSRIRRFIRTRDPNAENMLMLEHEPSAKVLKSGNETSGGAQLRDNS